jgi:hypothetical protein
MTPTVTTSASIWCPRGGRSSKTSWATVPPRAKHCTGGCCSIRTRCSSVACSPRSLTVLWLGGSAAARASWPIVMIVALAARDRHRGQRREPAGHHVPATPARCPSSSFAGSAASAPEGIPAECRTAVVVPILFGSVDAVEEALEHLEVQYLANREVHLHFALLSDFTDAPTEHREGDDAILECCRARHPRAQRPLRRSCAGPFLPLPPAAPLEPAAERVAGLGAEARQARAVQPLRAGHGRDAFRP